MKKIELSKTGKNRGKYFAIIDDDLFDEVNQYDWYYQNAGYAYNGTMKILLHRFIWILKFGEIPEGLDVEHKDRNKLNCQLSNLRLATRSENMCNVSKYKSNASGFKGICKKVHKKTKEDESISIYEYWYAQITKDEGKKTEKKYAKTFPYTEEGLKDAIEWYKQKSLDIQGKYSIYNKDK